MKAQVIGLDGKKSGEVELPRQFGFLVREDLIRRAYHAFISHSVQPYGVDVLAGRRQGRTWSKRRRDFGTTYGHGISRVRRKAMSRRGTNFGWMGAYTANAIGGFSAFAPKSDRNSRKEINKKERRSAICSAISASARKDVLAERYQNIKLELPVVVSGIEKINKIKDAQKLLSSLGLGFDLERAKERKIRAGKGKRRSRPYKQKKSVLVVVGRVDEKIFGAWRNLPGVNVVAVKDLNAYLLAPGGVLGRVVIWSEDAIMELGEKNYFIPWEKVMMEVKAVAKTSKRVSE